jgi:DNA mismatch repair protein MutL
MPDIIQLLPDSVANQIAAGEVIQRPASAVKELMENAVDAQSTQVKLIIKDAGKSLIQVIDNGSGMSETDARMSFERHATSKIQRIEDLFSIKTMGFRGEALPSIAAIAQVELKTKRESDDLSTHIIIEGSEVKSQESCQTADGTSFMVKNLFYNVPARRAFLKSNPVETRHIIEEFQRISLAHPEIGFSFFQDTTQVFQLKQGNLRQRIVGIFGDNYNEKVVPVEESTSIISVFGFVGKPEAAKKTRGEQYFFVNRRFIKSNYLNFGVVSAFEQMLPRDTYPFYVLFIDIDPAKIDINVHPTKQEIKFEDERFIYAFVHGAVKRALSQYSVTPTLDFSKEVGFDTFSVFSQTASRQQERSSSETDFAIEENRKDSPTHPFTSDPREQSNLKNWQTIYSGLEKRTDEGATISPEWKQDKPSEEKLDLEDFSPKEITPFQLHNRYIVTQIKSGFMLIDQQAAHERILFEKYMQTLANKTPGSQQQLFPKNITVSNADAELLKEILPDIQSLGFDVQEFGQNTFVLHGIPSDLTVFDENKILETLLEQYKNNITNVRFSKREGLARALARQAAIKSGQELSAKEMKMLIDRLFACEMPYTAPNGKMTFITFSLEELAKQFQKK